MKSRWVSSSEINSDLGINSLELKKRYSIERFFYSFLALIIFYLLYYFIDEIKFPTLDAFLGLVAIIFLGLSIFFLISYLILYFLRNAEQAKKTKIVKVASTKKMHPKITSKKKVVKNKRSTKKVPQKKKVIRKK